tara:strand:- start:19201 stop:20151 length:951 start_codon:yes stop_codon:yes gene_type:complete
MNEEINENYLDSEVDLKELVLLFWKKKVTIILLTSAFAAFSVGYALYLPNIYQSKSLLAPTDQQESLSSKLSSYKNLAGLAGVNLPGTGTTKTNEAIERIRSFKFFSEQFLPLIKLENLMALKKWVPENNSLVYDESLFDVKQSKWIRDVKYPLKVKPSEQEAFLTYQEILAISVDDETGFVSISMDHMSPVIAKKWLDIIIMNINTNMRELDKEKAKNSINFLNESSGSTSVQSIKIAIAALLEEQMQTLMLASSDEDYIFKVIDAPIVPEIKSSPSRAIICIIITLLGGFLSLLIVLIQSYYKKIIDFFGNNSY